MAQMLRNLVRYGGGLKSLAMPVQHQSVGIRSTGVRSLWHMSKSSIINVHNGCGCGLGGSCSCGGQKRFASTNGKIFILNPAKSFTSNQTDKHNLKIFVWIILIGLFLFRWKGIAWILARGNWIRKEIIGRSFAIAIGEFSNQIRFGWSGTF